MVGRDNLPVHCTNVAEPANDCIGLTKTLTIVAVLEREESERQQNRDNAGEGNASITFAYPRAFVVIFGLQQRKKGAVSRIDRRR
jgi:hypothetical protein